MFAYLANDLKTGDSIQLQLNGISQRYYNYMNILLITTTIATTILINYLCLKHFKNYAMKELNTWFILNNIQKHTK